MKNRTIKLLAITFLLGIYPMIQRYVLTVGAHQAHETRKLPPAPEGFFSPSKAQTVDGKLIPVEQFFPASRCLACHQDTHTAWSESLHRNATREPFYRESADILLRT